MLTTLRIKNLALVANLALELQPGSNVFTGETAGQQAGQGDYGASVSFGVWMFGPFWRTHMPFCMGMPFCRAFKAVAESTRSPCPWLTCANCTLFSMSMMNVEG